MGLFNNFPYMDLSNLNLDFILKKLKDLTNYVESAESDANRAETAKTIAVTAQNAAEAAARSAESSSRDAQAAETSAENYAAHIADPVGGLVTGWLDDNITPTTPPVDASLTIQGAAADAKAAGDAIDALAVQIANGMPYEVRQSLNNLLHKAGYLLGDADDDLDVINYWAESIRVVSITAVFNQGSSVIYDNDSLDVLRQYLTVTALFDNETTSVVTGYTLSGTLTEGTSVITATYGGKSTTFNVTVTHAVLPSGYTAYDYAYYTGETGDQPSASIIKSKTFANLNNVVIDFDFMPLAAKTTATGIIGGAIDAGNSNGVQFFTRTDTHRVSCFSHGTALYVEGVSSVAVNSKTHVNLNPHASSPSTLTVGAQTYDGSWTSSTVINAWITMFGTFRTNGVTGGLYPDIAVGVVKVFDLSNNLLAQLVPCVRNADNVVGFYDTTEQAFHTASTATYATIGNINCVYAVGNWE